MPIMSSRMPPAFRGRVARGLLVVCWAALIYAASSRPDLRVATDDTLDLIVRKFLHMLVFGVLLVLVAQLIRGPGPLRRRHIIGAWLLTLGYACSDEWHQTFVPGRRGQASDVLIDMVGASIASMLAHRRWHADTSRQEQHA